MTARPMHLLVALLLVGLAGCSNGGAGREAPDEPQPQPGELRGLVVDEAIRPLEGVRVAIPVRPEVAPATTDAEGLFTLQGVEPGAVFLEVTHDGFLSATVQATVEAGVATPLVQVVLGRLPESRPYAVLESFRGFIECGAGSAPAAGMSVGCMVTVGAALYVACTGGGPVPPTGVCIGGASPYFVSTAAGNMTVAQTEVVWDATVPGMSELLIGSYVVDQAGAVVGGAPGVSGHSVLVRRLDPPTVRELGLGGVHSLAIFVNPGNSGTANVVAQQAYEVYHTSTFLFEPDAAWTFAEHGPVPVPDTCSACLRP